MIKVQCEKCGDELNEVGGLALSPPHSVIEDRVSKIHLCLKCWDEFIKWLGGLS